MVLDGQRSVETDKHDYHNYAQEMLYIKSVHKKYI